MNILIFTSTVAISSGLIPFPPEPARVLPDLNGTAFAPYRLVFQPGECTGDDGRLSPVPGGPSPFGGSTLIDINKNCFSCFRIPTFIAGQTPGVIHAFAEGRRGELTDRSKQYTGSGAGGCPDGPDTRLVYKRSTTNGASWSSVRVFLQDSERAEKSFTCVYFVRRESCSDCEPFLRIQRVLS